MTAKPKKLNGWVNMNSASKFLLLIMTIATLSSCGDFKTPSPNVLWQDLQARKQLKAEKYEEALQLYYNLVEAEPNFAGTHSNIGVILNMIQRPEDALKSLEHSLQVARETKDIKNEFAAQFNLGVYYGALKKIDEAIVHYQEALEIVPTSNEAKTNIELLVQQQQQQSGQGNDSKENQQDQQNQNGQSGQNSPENKDQKGDEKKDQKDQQGDKDKEQEEQNKDDQGKDQQDKEQESQGDKQRESSAKYKPRPFQGEQLSEGDVKKILGELRNQEQKIRANFEKKEKGKPGKNEKDW